MQIPINRVHSWIYFLFSAFVLVNLLDLTTTIVAIRDGLSEMNLALLFLSNLTGAGVISTILALKAIFIAGFGSLVIIGVTSRDQRTCRMILIAEIAMTLVFFAVSYNNIVAVMSI